MIHAVQTTMTTIFTTTTMSNMTTMTMVSMATMRKLGVVHKEVGGCLTSSPTCFYKAVGGYLTRCAHIAASIALNDEW